MVAFADPSPSPGSHPTPSENSAKREEQAAKDRVRKAEAAAAVKRALDGADHTEVRIPPGNVQGGIGGKPYERTNK